MAMRPLFLASVVGACLLLASCASQVVESSGAAVLPSAASTNRRPSEAASASAPSSADAAPAEIAGTWRRNVRGEVVLLTLQDHGYRIQRGGDVGSGRISVDGDRITFSHSNLCDGVGVYTWAIEDDRLRLTEIEEDPCSGRPDVLLLGTFGRVEP